MAFSSSSLTFPPPCHHFQNSKSNPFFSSLLNLKTGTKFKSLSLVLKASAVSDPFVLQIAETLEDSHISSSSSSSNPILQKLRDSSTESSLSLSWPKKTDKDESFRYTDISFIKNSQISPISKNPNLVDFLLDNNVDIQTPNIVVILDGRIVNSLSNLDELPDNVYVGSILDIPSDEISEKVMKFVSDSENKDLFCSLNGIGAPDVAIVYVPVDCIVEKPLRFKFYSQQSSEIGSRNLPMSNPRVLVLVEKGGQVGIMEEYLSGGGDDKCYWVNAVMEVQIGEGGKVVHTYVQQEAPSAAHIKWTSVRQESSSAYELVEVSTGGKLGRHNLHIQPAGPDTITDVRSFHISARHQIQDLHSNIILDHPRGFARQRHKSIAVIPGQSQAVFDGNFTVNKLADNIDADQLARGLIVEDGATIINKPAIQARKDEVDKLSHGSTLGGVDENQHFYLRSRGINKGTAKQALVLAFGSDLMSRLPCDTLRKKVESHVHMLLDRTPS